MSARTTVMAALSYLSVLCFVPLVLEREDEFVYFHAKQGMVLWIWGVVALFSLHIPVLGGWIFGLSSMGVLVFSVLGLVSVVFQRAWKLPVISWLSDRF
ncbi:hypothetical protein [Magnetospirillum sp. UT-4]|uniref:hypothetical protein n=1 Tax=Magnetospirillum sp. UT-4 TaxID=2681467 RepID=UPI0020C3AF0C|nr:hypothetical protein [Magnetospirillum sp. UT-4]